MEKRKKETPAATEVERIWRRFECVNKENLMEAELLIERKQLNRQELTLLLKTFQLRDI